MFGKKQKSAADSHLLPDIDPSGFPTDEPPQLPEANRPESNISPAMPHHNTMEGSSPPPPENPHNLPVPQMADPDRGHDADYADNQALVLKKQHELEKQRKTMLESAGGKV